VHFAGLLINSKFINHFQNVVVLKDVRQQHLSCLFTEEKGSRIFIFFSLQLMVNLILQF